MADIYTILEQALEDKVMLGTGSFGYVYKATWKRRSVAVKYFNQRPIGDDQSSKREIEVLTHLEALQHPNIIRIYGMGVSGPQMFMVMELAPFALDHILHKCKDKYDYSTDHVISWSLQLAKALECCHHNGIIHRDIKPSNILLFDNGVNLKICDFGTAKKLEATFAYTFIGTPYYLAPEIMSDDCGHTYMCDMYSFAIILWEMVTRHKPTLSLKHKKTPNAIFVFNSVGKGERPPLIVGIPSFLSEIITRCWSHNPQERLTASEIASKLHNVATRYFNDNFPLIDKNAIHLLQSQIQKHIDKQGELNVTVAKGLLYGPPRVGKTSLMRRLIGEEPELLEKCASTGIDSPISVPIYKDAQFMQVAIRQGKDPYKDEWKPQDIKETLKLCLNSFFPAHKLKEDESLRRSEDPVASTLPSPLAGGNGIINKIIDNNKNEAFSKEYYHVHVIPDSVTDQTNDDIMGPDNVDIPTKILDFIKNEDWMSAREKLTCLEDMTLFQIIDVGGQPEFHDILPLLLTGPAMYILFFNLTQELDQPYTYLYQHKNGSNSLAYKSQLTVFKVLHQILSSISSMSEYSPAIVIGTHLDELKSTDDVWKHTDDPLKDRMKEHFYYKKNLIPNQVDGENCIVFPVDNINGTMEDEIKPLRQKIKAKLKELKGTPLPTSWALFYYLLKTFDNNGKWYCTLDEAKRLAEELNIKDVEEALKYFHERFGSVLYYHDVADEDNNKYVFCDPNVILSAVNDLVAVCFGSNPEKLQITETLRDTGMVTCEEFNELCSSFGDKSLCSFVTELLKNRNIFSVNGSDEFFIPCLLHLSNDTKYIPSSLPQSEEVAPLLLKLSCKEVSRNKSFNFIPPGLFSSTLVKLSNNKPRWELIDGKRFKNKVTFSCSNRSASLSVTLIAQDDWIEVRVNEEPTSLTPSCIDIRKDIEKAITVNESDSLLGQFLQSVKLNVGFYCQENEHYASMKNETQMACSSCSKEGKVYFQPLMSKHKMWFEENNINTDSCSALSDISLHKFNLHHKQTTSDVDGSSISSSPSPSLADIMSKTPKLNHLVEVLVGISDKWELMGIALDVECHRINSIKNEERDDRVRLLKILQEWLNSDEDVTWTTIVEAVQGPIVDNKSQVDKINKFLSKPNILKKYM